MTLSYRYSVDHDELFDVVRREFGRWLAYELAHGGTTELRVDYRIGELVERYTPSSPRQLLELALQCEALTDIALEDPIFGHRPEDAYDALRIAVARALNNDLWALWESAGADAASSARTDEAHASDGNGAALSGQGAP